ncbi:MAG TPA: hypothetical protein VGB62_03735 [Allosphingosinicella sp.]
MTHLARLIGTAALLALLGGCVPKQEQAPQVETPQPVRPAPQPAQPRPAPSTVNWPDLPLAPGTWTYRDEGRTSTAAYGVAGGQPVFVMRCDKTARQVTLARLGASPAPRFVIRTSNGDRTLGAAAQPALPGYLAAALPSSDRFLDALAFSRGRFAVEAQGLERLVLPSWAEISRAIEDCR